MIPHTAQPLEYPNTQFNTSQQLCHSAANITYTEASGNGYFYIFVLNNIMFYIIELFVE